MVDQLIKKRQRQHGNGFGISKFWENFPCWKSFQTMVLHSEIYRKQVEETIFYMNLRGEEDNFRWTVEVDDFRPYFDRVSVINGLWSYTKFVRLYLLYWRHLNVMRPKSNSFHNLSLIVNKLGFLLKRTSKSWIFRLCNNIS